MRVKVTEIRPGLGRYRLTLAVRKPCLVSFDVGEGWISLDLEVDYLDLLSALEVFLPELMGLCQELGREVRARAGLAAGGRPGGQA